jgi:hypothetical protein
MKIEFRIPVSPDKSFYSQLRLFALSLAKLGEPYSTARIVVCVGNSAQYDAVVEQNSWAKDFPVEWSVASPEFCEEFNMMSSGLWRYSFPSDADVIILCDADTCVINRFDGLLAQMVRTSSAVAGVQAHYSPFPNGSNESSWKRALAAIGQDDFMLQHGYSMEAKPCSELSPPYFNYGFVLFNREAFKSLSSIMQESLSTAMSTFPENVFAAQIALSLAIIKKNVFAIMLGHEYNCANDDSIVNGNFVDILCIRVIHYLRTNEFDRHNFLCDKEKFNEFINTNKRNVISARLRIHVESIKDCYIDWD